MNKLHKPKTKRGKNMEEKKARKKERKRERKKERKDERKKNDPPAMRFKMHQ